MGVSITCKNPIYDFDMGYGSFASLRKNIALAIDREFGELYNKFIHCFIAEDRRNIVRETNAYIEQHPEIFTDELHDVMDFLYAPDCEGKINYKTCGKIYDIIKDVDFGEKSFRYAYESHNDYKEFKEFLKDCYSHRKNMTWY